MFWKQKMYSALYTNVLTIYIIQFLTLIVSKYRKEAATKGVRALKIVLAVRNRKESKKINLSEN